MRTFLLLCSLCSLSLITGFTIIEQSQEATRQYKEVRNTILGAVEHALSQANRRSVASICASMGSLTTDQLADQLAQSMARNVSASDASTCVTPMANFIQKVMCTTACKASPFFASMRRSDRMLLGGNFNPSTMCVDPCYPLLVGDYGIVPVITAVTNPSCASMYGSSRRSQASMATMMTTILQSLCSMNSNGQYCVNIVPSFNPNISTSINLTEAQVATLSISDVQSKCYWDTPSVALFGTLGCCWGMMQQIAFITTDDPDRISEMQLILSMVTSSVSGCGVTLSTQPCSSAGVASSYVMTSVSLTVSNCSSVTSATTLVVAQAVAQTANVSVKNVQVTGASCSRRSGVQVATSTTVPVGKSATDVQSSLSNQATLNTNLQTKAAGTSLAGATVAQTSSLTTTSTTKKSDSNRVMAPFLVSALLSGMVAAW